MNKSASIGALVLIAVAIAGAGISYHFTLDSRFNELEQKLQANQVALQQYQIAQDTIFSSKTEALNHLTKELDTLQASLGPLGKSNQEQTQSLGDIRKEIETLRQSQQAQQDAQKKLADYAGQIEKLKHDVQAPAPVITPVSATPTPSVITPVAPAPAPVTTTINNSAPVPAAGAPLPVAPKTDKTVVDLRPAETTLADASPVRVYPVAVPVEDSNR